MPEDSTTSDQQEPTIADMTNIRFLALTYPTGLPMQAYYQLEEQELRARLAARRDQSQPLVLWLRCLGLFKSAFSGTYEFGEIAEENERRSQILAFELLALAGTTSKPAVDDLVAGYYSQSYGHIRTMLETWRRVEYLRLNPVGIDTWWPMQDSDSDNSADRELNLRPPSAKEIARVFDAVANDEMSAALKLVEQGIKHFHSGSHPSIEGTTQLWGEDNQRIFGPTYRRDYCEFGLRWGLFAQVLLLHQVLGLRQQPDEWVSELKALEQDVLAWMRSIST